MTSDHNPGPPPGKRATGPEPRETPEKTPERTPDAGPDPAGEAAGDQGAEAAAETAADAETSAEGDERTPAGPPPARGDVLRLSRELAMRLLFQYQASGQKPRETVMTFEGQFGPGNDDEESLELPGEVFAPAWPRATKLFLGAVENLAEIDGDIDRAAHNWALDRISQVDLAILRIAYFEMRFDPDVPPTVCINEAIEIAKSFGDQGSPAFVNGVLDRLKAGKDKDKDADSDKPARPGGDAPKAGARQDRGPKKSRPKDNDRRGKGPAGKGPAGKPAGKLPAGDNRKGKGPAGGDRKEKSPAGDNRRNGGQNNSGGDKSGG
ncbi:MAG: transcription antitermination factor NusB [Deltaproteobacteria bacterium]|nr:transcription antitermination factor NusB [Deltaproteobacteria bacterium]